MIRRKCAENRLSNDHYVGLVRTSDHVIFADLDARAFRGAAAGEGEEPCILPDGSAGERECIEENDVLAAVLEGHSAHKTIELAAPVLCSPAFANAIGERSGRGRQGRTFSVEVAKDERRNELQNIMRDRSLGKDERRSRTAKVKRDHEEGGALGSAVGPSEGRALGPGEGPLEGNALGPDDPVGPFEGRSNEIGAPDSDGT